MARADPQINLRIPAALKSRIERAAVDNKRSMNAEIAARLEASFDLLAPNESLNLVGLPGEKLDRAVQDAMLRILENNPGLLKGRKAR